MQKFQELNILVQYVQMIRFGFIHWDEELLVLAMEEIEMNSVILKLPCPAGMQWMYQSIALFVKVQAWLYF